MRQFSIQPESISDNGNIVANCNSITFYNKGGQTATVADVNLATGESFEISGGPDEMDVSTYPVVFSGSGSMQLIVLRKTYL